MNKRYSLTVFRYWGTPDQQIIAGVDVDGFDELCSILEWLMRHSFDPLIMNSGPFATKRFTAQMALDTIQQAYEKLPLLGSLE